MFYFILRFIRRSKTPANLLSRFRAPTTPALTRASTLPRQLTSVQLIGYAFYFW